MKSLLLVRPKNFGYNHQTSGSNAFQHNVANDDIHSKATDEFNRMLRVLKLHHIPHTVVDDTVAPVKPDAIFPNNWFSTHASKTLVLYPMEAQNRRQERRPEIIQQLEEEFGYKHTIDLTEHEKDGVYLEGTGSLVLDRENRVAFLARSSRSNADLADELCERLGYELIVFTAVDALGTPIYHTNVVVSVGSGFLIWAKELIHDESDLRNFEKYLSKTGKSSIEISNDQVLKFAGNVLEVKNTEGHNCLLLSSSARRAYSSDQILELRNHCSLIPIPIPTIEKVGGGSVRCCLAELS